MTKYLEPNTFYIKLNCYDPRVSRYLSVSLNMCI